MNEYMNSDEIARVKRKNLWALFFINLIHGMGAGMFNVVYQPFILEITDSVLTMGILVTIGGIVQFLPMALIGKLSDRFGRKKMMLGSIPFYILGLITLIFSSSTAIFFLILGIVLYFLGVVINSLSSLIFISENSNKSKGLMYGLILFSFFGGTIFGSIFILLGEALDSRVFFLIFLEITLGESIINIGFISEKFRFDKNPTSVPLKSSDIELSVWKKIINNPKSKAVLIFLTLDLFIYNIGLSIYSGALTDFYLITIPQLAIMTLVFNISTMLFQIPMGHIADKIGKKKSLIYSQYFGLSFFAINILAYFVWAGGFTAFLLPAVILSRIPFAMSVCTFIPSEQMALTDLGETRKAESYGTIGMIRGLGFIPTGYIGGFLVENVHYVAPLLISFIGIFFELWYLTKYFHD
jgi:MFS family permease